jgi:HD superfamily phosphodiesterase
MERIAVTSPRTAGRYDEVWRAAAPYMRARKNDIHIPLSYGFAARLLEAHPDADTDIVLLAILLHDTGWHSIDMADILDEVFGPNAKRYDVRILHEKESVRLAGEILRKTSWPEATITAVCEIIDRHDTRSEPRSLNDRLVRDADKLWRFTVTGLVVVGDWFKKTPHEYAEWCDRLLDDMETKVGRYMAERELAQTRATLMMHLI